MTLVPTIYENEADAKQAAHRDSSPKPPASRQRRKMWGSGAAKSAESAESSSGSGGDSKSKGSKSSKEEQGSGTSSTTPFMTNHLNNSDAKSLFSVYVSPDDNVSILTDDFHDLDMNQNRHQRKNGGHHHLCVAPSQNALFTFRRQVYSDDEGSTRETTLQAKLAQPIYKEESSSSSSSSSAPKKTKYTKEESMSDLVKRLQEMAKTKASGVLRFPKEERLAIKDGDKRIVFCLPQLNNAKFSKEEFGQMKAGEVLGLVPDRPVLVDIETEDTGDGETLELF